LLNQSHPLKGVAKVPSPTNTIVRLLTLSIGLNALGALLTAQTVPPTSSSFFSDPQPNVTITGGQVVLRKELTAFGNYGRDGQADILYTSQAATWHFAIPPSITPDQVQGAFFRASLVADDHGTGTSPYALAIWVNGTYLGNGPSNLPYGAPFSMVFNDWVARDYPVTTVSQPYTLTLQNTSSAQTGDWIAVDWIELHLPLPPGTVFPAHAGNGGPVSLNIIGSNLDAATKVTLTGIGPDISSRSVTAGDGALTATFDLTGASAGLRTLVISTPAGTNTIPNGFTVEQDRSPDVWVANYELVSKQATAGTQSYITYRGYLVNPGPGLASVTATLATLDPFSVRVLPGLGTLNFAPVPTHAYVASTNTFTILADPTVPFDSSKLQWTFQTAAGLPVSNPGPNQAVKAGSTVTLDGSGSTNPSGVGTLSYSWSFISRPPGTSTRLFYTETVMPTFLADVAGTYVIALTVSNGIASSTAAVTITSTE
jgi:hypothetical protein